MQTLIRAAFFVSKRCVLPSVSHCFRNFSEETIVRSKVPDIKIPRNVSLHEFVWKSLDQKHDKVATVCFETGRSYTYEQLYKKSSALAGFLRNSFRLNPRDKIAIVLPNLLEYPVIVLGAIDAGFAVTTCNPYFTPDEMKQQLADSEAKLVFTSSSLAEQVRKVTNEIEPGFPVIIVNDGQASAKFSAGQSLIDFGYATSGEPFTPVTWADDDVIFLPYSSGTTGRPKGVQLTLSNIVSNLNQMATEEFSPTVTCQNDFQEVVPAILPFYHIYGLVIIILHCLSQGCKLVVVPKFGVNNLVNVLRNYRPTVLFSVPTIVNLLTNHPDVKPDDLVSLNKVVSGAAPLGAIDAEKFLDKSKGRIRLAQGYGMTETSSVVCTQSTHFVEESKIGGSGFLLPNTLAKIIPVDGSSLVGLGPEESGELLIKGPQIMKGYFKNPEATRTTLLEDGWMRTGDVAHYDEHEQLYITDRIKELIKVKGLQVAPAELEEILRDHPLIDDAAVIGVPHPHLGEAPRAFVVTKKGARQLTSSNVTEYVAAKVAKHKHLVGGVVFTDSIPKTPSGKILRKELRKYS